MAILSHGSDLTLAPTVSPLVKQAGQSLRAALGQLSAAGFAAVQLDAALSGIRPRDLDQRARRDLSAALARQSLRLAGLDMFIAHRDFLSGDQVDRAVSATLAAIELAGDLGRVPLSITLPVTECRSEVKAALVEAADGHGMTLAVYAEQQLDDLRAWVEEVDLPALGMAVDPAAILARRQDPSAIVHQHNQWLRVGRLSDFSSQAGGEGERCICGMGELDVIPYRIALDLCPARLGPVVLDLRRLSDPLEAARRAAKAWEKAGMQGDSRRSLA